MTPPWVNKALYPFEPKRLEVGSGELSYVDVGTGPTLLMVHGTPSWSFIYRDLIKTLSAQYRCVALDHMGFGLSAKPEKFAYTPQAHAETLTTFINILELKDITLLVHDFGGPIGLSYGLEQPNNIRALIIMNTWLWHFESLSRAGQVLANPLGSFLYKSLDLSVNVLLKRSAFADPSTLTPELLSQYKGPFPSPASREPLFELVNTIAESNAWFDTLWKQRDALRSKPTLLAWGMKDKLIPEAFLQRWRDYFRKAEVLELAEAGHFLQEEAGVVLAATIKEFLADLQLEKKA